jgi:uncharacterized membrane protein
MNDVQPQSSATRAQLITYVFTSFLGGLIRKSSLSMLMLCFVFAAAAVAVNKVNSLWQQPGVRSFVAALGAGFAGTDVSAANLDPQPPGQPKDLEKIQRDENRARRKLAKELRQHRASASGIKSVRQKGR